MSITRKELTDILAQETHIPPPKCAQYIDQVFEIIVEALERGEAVKISGFGRFTPRSKQARRGRNPQTGEPMKISARRVVTFKPSSGLRKIMGGPSI